MRIAFVSTGDWIATQLFEKLLAEHREYCWIHLTEKLQVDMLGTRLGACDIALFFRWPHIVSKQVFSMSKCIVFHTSDLPEGRGGSPIQNQIMEGAISSKVNAIQMTEQVDAGPVYASAPVTLQGSASDIWLAISHVVFKLIGTILLTDPRPFPQSLAHGKPFKRRTDNDLAQVSRGDIEKVLRFIQMLDGPGYPGAFVDMGDYRLTLSRAGLCDDGSVLCDAKIRRRL